ncbi:neural cell adhesion molecule L1-like protein isoform X3 [Cololabis saira]|uniref:neural cell adhesion molecule L1-like protein isoform X3 n=1 Tax=Cololabis saira TaxID=129043 RepID=UPI002AD2673D|nr:neural cell adhesion molecule L1-like protein isoform X3 [Cololabis saira]
MRLMGSLLLVLLWAFTSRATGLSIPLEVEQPPTIISHTTSPVIALPFDNTITIRCEATGNPPPIYRWTKDGQDLILPNITTIRADHTDGTLMFHNKHFLQFQGIYRCLASNKLGTAMTGDIKIIVSTPPKFPKEALDPVVVEQGEPIILECNPPQGVPPRQIYWMSIGLRHIEQDERVSMGTNGNLYFSYALHKDSREDYCCFAAFHKIRTIVQKSAMAVVVKSYNDSSESGEASESGGPPVRAPSLLLPSGVQSAKVLLKGEDLQLECIPGGFPTPSVTWMKMGDSLSDRVKLSNFQKLLSIPSVDEKDQGKYMCTAENSAGKAVHYFDVIVREPPTWLAEPPPTQLTVITSDVHIKCSVRGRPPPDITWRRNGELFRDDPETNRRVLDDTLVIHNARPEDSGVYQCEASNSHGSILANVNVMVMNLAPFILTKDFQEYAVILGGDVVMNCSVFSSPPSSISWNKNGTDIEGGRVVGLENRQSLKIISTEKDDSGRYVCVAKNTEGTSSVTAVLDVKDPTKIVSPPQDVQIVSGTSTQLMCVAEYDKSLQDTFEVVWRKNGEEISLTPEENSRYIMEGDMLQIMNVNLDDQGMYTCVAKTSLDEDNASALITVLDVPDAPTRLKISEVKNPRNITLSWEPGSDHNSSVTEFVVEYEETQWEPGRWKELQKVPGNQATAEPALHGHLNYQFRVYAVNAVGPGPPSEPTERYKTPSAAPDRNPENIKIEGHLPHQMDVSWEPLRSIECNGPGLEYKLSYRKLGVEDMWEEQLVRRPSFVVRNTSTFVPYEIRVQSRNSLGWGPEPKTVTGYSGEDVPTAAPRDIGVEVVNTTVLRVSWTPVPPATVRGHLGGYNVHWVKRKSLLNPGKTFNVHNYMSFPGKRSHAIVPGLEPFSEYKLTVNVFNKKGNGPRSDPVTFSTPEGVPGLVPILTASNSHADSVLLVWGPPLEANGVLSGYLLRYHLLNETSLEVIDSREMNITEADITQWHLRGLEGDSLYRFHLSACTRAGCGPPMAQESRTVAAADLNSFLSVPSSIPSNSTHPPLVPALLNISSYVSDTYAKISWTAAEEHGDSQLYVAYMNNRDGIWYFSEAVNTSQSFHVIDGLKPGTLYTVRLMAKKLLDNASIFEDVIETRVKGVANPSRDFSTERWFIGTMCAVALLTLVALVACFLRKNKGGKYAGTLPPQQLDMFSMEKVKEKEDVNPDTESQEMNDDAFYEYSDSDKKPLRGSSSCSGDDAVGDSVSRDSLVDYADEGGDFNEDGSFIGEYSEFKHRGSVSESSGPGRITA